MVLHNKQWKINQECTVEAITPNDRRRGNRLMNESGKLVNNRAS